MPKKINKGLNVIKRTANFVKTFNASRHKVVAFHL